jgi:hypothetical protein
VQEAMNEQKRAMSSEHIVATAAVASAVFSLLAVGVTLYVAYVQDRATERQNQYSRALGYSGIYFSDQVSQARDLVDTAYFDGYETIRQSPDPNGEVARLLHTSAQQLAFDKLLAMYEQIAACANTDVCSADVTGQLFGRDIQSIYQNWFGYIVNRRARLGSTEYGCQIAKYLQKDYPKPDCTATTSKRAKAPPANAGG